MVPAAPKTSIGITIFVTPAELEELMTLADDTELARLITEDFEEADEELTELELLSLLDDDDTTELSVNELLTLLDEDELRAELIEDGRPLDETKPVSELDDLFISTLLLEEDRLEEANEVLALDELIVCALAATDVIELALGLLNEELSAGACDPVLALVAAVFGAATVKPDPPAVPPPPPPHPDKINANSNQKQPK